MQLTETQIQQANKLIKKYKFCTLETQKELQENGFYSHCVVNHFLIFIDKCDSKDNKDECLCVLPDSKDAEFYTEKGFSYLPMPQFCEVWAALPELVTNNYFLFSKKINMCEAACKLWLKLKKENLL